MIVAPTISINAEGMTNKISFSSIKYSSMLGAGRLHRLLEPRYALPSREPLNGPLFASRGDNLLEETLSGLPLKEWPREIFQESMNLSSFPRSTPPFSFANDSPLQKALANENELPGAYLRNSYNSPEEIFFGPSKADSSIDLSVDSKSITDRFPLKSIREHFPENFTYKRPFCDSSFLVPSIFNSPPDSAHSRRSQIYPEHETKASESLSSHSSHSVVFKRGLASQECPTCDPITLGLPPLHSVLDRIKEKEASQRFISLKHSSFKHSHIVESYPMDQRSPLPPMKAFSTRNAGRAPKTPRTTTSAGSYTFNNLANSVSSLGSSGTVGAESFSLLGELSTPCFDRLGTRPGAFGKSSYYRENNSKESCREELTFSSYGAEKSIDRSSYIFDLGYSKQPEAKELGYSVSSKRLPGARYYNSENGIVLSSMLDPMNLPKVQIKENASTATQSQALGNPAFMKAESHSKFKKNKKIFSVTLHFRSKSAMRVLKEIGKTRKKNLKVKKRTRVNNLKGSNLKKVQRVKKNQKAQENGDHPLPHNSASAFDQRNQQVEAAYSENWQNGKGCWTCRVRHKSCPQDAKSCGACTRLGLFCDRSETRPDYMRNKEYCRKMKRDIREITDVIRRRSFKRTPKGTKKSDKAEIEEKSHNE